MAHLLLLVRLKPDAAWPRDRPLIRSLWFRCIAATWWCMSMVWCGRSIYWVCSQTPEQIAMFSALWVDSLLRGRSNFVM